MRQAAMRLAITAAGAAHVFAAFGAAAFTREEGVRMERDLESRQVSASAMRDGETITPGTPLARENGSIRLDSLTVIDRDANAQVGGALSQEDTGAQKALNGDLEL